MPFFFLIAVKRKREEGKKTVGAVVQIRCTATPLMSLTPLNRSLHICLFRFVDFYLFSPVIYLKQHLSRGGPGREATLCCLPLPPALPFPDNFPSLAFQKQRHLERHICLETYETILSCCQRKTAYILRTVC